ncbi:hypothetical protein QJQ45_007551 [Haematococcus lacustris]|nr:hypothetical protein QJQ45_007551 [Haematococcus lacustris]
MRGDNMLQVDRTNGLVVGQWVSLLISNTNRQLFSDINRGASPGCMDVRCFQGVIYTHTSRVAAVPSSTSVVLERPLPFNVSLGYSPQLHHFLPDMSGVGIQGMTLRFMSPRYPGHFVERGWNGVQFIGVSNCWIKDLTVLNADMGIMLGSTQFCTVTDVTIDADSYRMSSSAQAGHHAINLGGVSDTLITRFNIARKYVHDLSVDFFTRSVVWSEGTGLDVNLDHHKGQTYSVLWTNLDLGLGTRPWDNGGSANRGLDAGTFTTYWRVTGSGLRPLRVGPRNWQGPWLNYVGLTNSFPSLDSNNLTRTWWVERLSPHRLQPPNLHLAQRNLRLASPGKSIAIALISPSLTPSPCPFPATSPPIRHSIPTPTTKAAAQSSRDADQVTSPAPSTTSGHRLPGYPSN